MKCCDTPNVNKSSSKNGNVPADVIAEWKEVFNGLGKNGDGDFVVLWCRNCGKERIERSDGVTITSDPKESVFR